MGPLYGIIMSTHKRELKYKKNEHKAFPRKNLPDLRYVKVFLKNFN